MAKTMNGQASLKPHGQKARSFKEPNAILPSELRAQARKPLYNKVILLVGLLVFLIGLSGLVGTWLDIDWLRTYSPFAHATPIAVQTAISLVALGIALKIILDSHPYEEKPAWLWPVRWISLLVPAIVGLYWIVTYAFTPGFDFLDIGTYGLHRISFLTACFLTLSPISLLIFLTGQRSERAVVYLVCMPAILIFNIGLMGVIGYFYQVPVLYSFRMALPTAIAAILIGLIILIGTVPFRGLLLPLLSEYPKARWIGILSFTFGIGTLLFSLNSIAVSLRYNQVSDTAMLSLDMRHLYTLAIMATGFVAITIKMLGLRAARYYSRSLYYGEQQAQAAEREAVIRSIIQTVHASLDLEEIFQQISEKLGRYLKADRVFISRYDEGATQLSPPTQEYRSHAGITSLMAPNPPLWNAISEYAVNLCPDKCCPVDFHCYSEGLSVDTQTCLQEIQVQSGLACPILYRNRCYAVLFVHQVTQDRQWSKDEEFIIQEVAAQAGVAMYQAELYQEEQKARQALLESEAQWQMLANSMSQLAWMARPDGWIYWYNDRWYEYTGTTLEEMQGWGWQKVHHPDHVERVIAFIKDAWTRGDPWELTFPLRSHNGEYRWFLTHAYPVRESHGRVVRWIGTNTDITERFEMEETLKEKERKLAESNRDLEHFAAIASHDLQAPLRKTKVFCEQIYEAEKEHVSPESRDLMERVHRSLDTMQNLINDLLALSKVEKSGKPFRKVNLDTVLKRALINLDDQIQAKQAEIETGKLETLFADESQLEQLLQNLVENGLKYQPDGQTPVIKVYSTCQDEQFCELIVEDNGIGLDPAHAERIFQPFERLHGRSSPYEGTGVGLAICKRIVERHEGTIKAESTPGQGSRFTVRLPYRPNLAKHIQEMANGASP